MRTCDYVSVLSVGDEPGCDFFLRFAVEAALDRRADFIYGDERRDDPSGTGVKAFFKPQWSPDLLLSMNYLGRAWCARSALLPQAGLHASDFGRAFCGYDLVLRLTEHSDSVRHIPATLLQLNGPPERASLERRALATALRRRKIVGKVIRGPLKGAYRIRRKVKAHGLVSIIIPTCAARALVKTCIGTLRALTAERNFEIICVENIPSSQSDDVEWLHAHADKVISTAGPFNWSRFNNLAAAAAKGEFLLFLNDDVEVIEEHWLDALLEHAQRPEVGVVGAQLLYPDHRVQHAGMFLARSGIARHAFRYAAADDPGYFALALSQRNVIAVTGACLMTRRSTFDSLGGFDEAHGVINNDLDFCLRAWERGLVNVYTPAARLIHHECASRTALSEDYDIQRFEVRWRRIFAAGDPYFSPHLDKDRDDYSMEAEPVEQIFAARPLFAREAVRRILLVKLDHIGDCVLALPAVRRLKQRFAVARLSVLTSPASRAVWAHEPAITEIIEFDYFHARSDQGIVARSDEDFAELKMRLEPKRYDLAIDLRRHTETRDVLRYSGATYLAGFDTRGQFPWLDIALESSQDSPLFAEAPSHRRRPDQPDRRNQCGRRAGRKVICLFDATFKSAAACRRASDVLEASRVCASVGWQ